MHLTETIKLFNTKQTPNIKTALQSYITAVNGTVSFALRGNNISKFGSGDIIADLPSAVRSQICQDARSIVKKYCKACHKAVIYNRKEFEKAGKLIEDKLYKPKLKTVKVPVVKNPCCYWNNQSFKINESGQLDLPLMLGGKSTRIKIPTTMTPRQWNRLHSSKLGTMRIVYKNKKLVAQITYEVAEPEPADGHTMGIDLGLKCPAVTYIDTGKVKFFGNGRKNKYMKRFYRYQRKKLQSLKHTNAIKKLDNKEQRIMAYEDHRVSRRIIEHAVKNNVTTIKMEQLAIIRSTARTSRKNKKNLHTWSFYRLQQFIEYKARLAGIRVIYVNPKYTSQACPKCSKLNHAKDRNYVCSCGFHMHRDIVGAVNIENSTVYVKTA